MLIAVSQGGVTRRRDWLKPLCTATRQGANWWRFEQAEDRTATCCSPWRCGLPLAQEQRLRGKVLQDFFQCGSKQAAHFRGVGNWGVVALPAQLVTAFD